MFGKDHIRDVLTLLGVPNFVFSFFGLCRAIKFVEIYSTVGSRYSTFPLRYTGGLQRISVYVIGRVHSIIYNPRDMIFATVCLVRTILGMF